MAPKHIYLPPPKKRKGARGCQRRMEGHGDLGKGTIAHGVEVGRGRDWSAALALPMLLM